ncbi:MAG: DUF1499 domain-containing protein [Henriciella sp.]|uniref:DUF1499 domain-containing protein n=1 Tax=Henriciella sp. TaxID=1968823 RepID=UPI002629FC84|nr:DUF1499 domain-containing protein [Henriciella sp.]
MSKRVDFETVVRPGSPNTYLVAPEGLCRNAEPDAFSPEFAFTPDGLFSAFEEVIEQHGNWTIRGTDTVARQIDLIAVTKVLKFRDDVALRALPVEGAPEKSKLAVYSRSRVGYHDLGANRKRVERLIVELKEKV